MSPIVLGPGVGGTPRTFKELQDEVLAHGFDDTRYRTRVKAWLNEGFGRVVRRSHLAEQESEQLIVTAAGTAAYPLDSDIVRITELFEAATSTPLDPVAIDQIDTVAAASGQPGNYALLGDSAILYPTPDAVYELTLRVRRRAAKLVNDGDVPTLDDDYCDLPVMWALHKAFAAEDDFEASNFWLGRFETELPRARSDLQRRQTDRVRQVPGMFAGGARPTFARPS